MISTAEYVKALNETLAGGDSTEHSHRPALKAWIESFKLGITATNEPKKSSSNAPDFDIKTKRQHGWLSLGKIESKDVGISPGLAQIEADSERERPRSQNGKQLKRYRLAFGNLLFTDQVEFRWYQGGDLKLTAKLGERYNGEIVVAENGPEECESIVRAFLAADPQKVGSARALAERLAALAAIINDVLRQSLASGTSSDHTVGLSNAFRDTLVPDLSDHGFADMLAQTIVYGLFAARVQHFGDEAFTRQVAARYIPKTNPFLRGLFGHVTGASLDDEPYAGVVDDLAQLLNDADMSKILRNFGQDRRDPIVHFYETFLKSYDPDLRDIRGVYYTPLPVVDFIVASVDQILKQDFGLKDGISDTTRTSSDGEHKVLLLDPATGTGTFLYASVARIRQTFIDKKKTALWGQYVSEHLLPRLFGFELMVAPYAIAHLKLALQLAGRDLPEEQRQEIAYDFEKDERIGVYLTNALDPGEAHSTLDLGKFISDEANAASEVKTDKPIMVVFGNPPYQGQSANDSTRRIFSRKVKGRDQYRTVKTAIGELLDDYYSVDGKPLGEINPKWLQDDYVKFIRSGQARIQATGQGVLAYVTNHTYLDAPTFRGMRQSLLQTFNDIYVLDLHGSTRRRDVNPHGGTDDNVFDQIQQGVCVTIFVKRVDESGPATVHYSDLWGSRLEKYDWLDSHTVSDVDWEEVAPTGPFYTFRPENADIREEWNAAISLLEIFPTYSTGVVTHRDDFAVDTRKKRLQERLADFCDPKQTDSHVRTKYFGTKSRTTSKGITYAPGDNRDWKMSERRASLMRDSKREQSIKQMTHRPFDNRYVMYHADAIDGLKYEVMRHFLNDDNLGLISARSNKSAVQDQFFVSDRMSEVKAGEATTGSVMFPLWLNPIEVDQSAQTMLSLESQRVPNIGPAVRDALLEKLGLDLVDDEEGRLSDTIAPRDILDYVYAVTHSRTYRLRYAQFLRSDYARIPITSDRATFEVLRDLGNRLIALHTLSADDLENDPVSSPTKGSNKIQKMGPSARWVDSLDGNGHIVLNSDSSRDDGEQIIPNVSEAIWNFRIGGHQVIHKWLDARVGDTLTYDETLHLVRMINSISRTIDVEDEIDEAIPNWPIS